MLSAAGDTRIFPRSRRRRRFEMVERVMRYPTKTRRKPLQCAMTSDKITPEEQARRRYAVEQANAHNRIEGIMPNTAADAIYERWIAGEIDSDEVTRRIRTIPLRHFGPD
jgi:hypothetical protein